MHPVGGTVIGYAELSRQLGPPRPFYALPSRGLEGSLPPCQTVEEMAALYVEAIRTVQPSGPYLLGDWSMGGVLAYEMAQPLRRQGEQVEQVLLIDAQVPTGRPANLPGGGVEQVRAPRDVFEANLRALWHYQPTAYVGEQLPLLRASKPAPGQAGDRGGAALAPDKLDIHEVPGAHFELLQPPAVQAVAERLREYLERAHEQAAATQRIP